MIIHIPIEVQLSFNEIAEYLRIYFHQIEGIEAGPMFYSVDDKGDLEVHFKAIIESSYEEDTQPSAIDKRD